MRKLKVVWVCHFSDSKTRSFISFDKWYYRHFLCLLFKRPLLIDQDFAVWITNAIRFFETFKDIELFIVFPHLGIAGGVQQFTNKGIHYFCFRSEDDNIVSHIKEKLFKKRTDYKTNSLIINKIIREVNPDLIHLIGAENPRYSISALGFPTTVPSLLSLQTLMSTPGFMGNYPIDSFQYDYRTHIEKEVIRRCNYIASGVDDYLYTIKRSIKENAIELRLPLAVGVDVELGVTQKEYDFVFFSANIIKGASEAIEAFALACNNHPELTLNISGAYTEDFKKKLDLRIDELGISKKVFFTGSKKTHEELFAQIKKSRFALIPLSVDYISSTIREAMACGLPVVTNKTGGTPSLNKKRVSVLLSDVYDFQSMADDMVRLVEDEKFAELVRENAILTVMEKYSNSTFMENWRRSYYAIINHFLHGETIPNDLLIEE